MCSEPCEGFSIDAHIPNSASAIEKLSHAHAAQISRGSTLLIDDDAQNVNDALANGVGALLYVPADPSCVARGIAALAQSPA